MSIRKGTKIIVNTDVKISGVKPGGTYEAMGGLHELSGATILNDEGMIKYLNLTQFELENERLRSNKETESGDEGSTGVDRFLRP